MSLGDILEAEIQGEIAQISRDTQERAAQIVSSARSRAQTMLDSRARALETDYNAGLTRARSAADLDANAQRLSAGDTLQAQAFQTAESQLRQATQEPQYPQIVARLIQEGLGALPSATIVETASAEQDAVRQALGQIGKQLDVRVNDSVVTGVRLLAADGKTSVQNTLLGRLQAGRGQLSAQVSRLLAQG